MESECSLSTVKPAKFHSTPCIIPVIIAEFKTLVNIHFVNSTPDGYSV